MNKIHENLEKLNLHLNYIDINDISSFLLKSGFLQRCSFSKKHLSILNMSSSYDKVICNKLEFNEKINFNEASIKYKNTITSINKIFNINASLDEIYNQYIFYTKVKVHLNQFINWIIILDLIITNFNDIFNFDKMKCFNNLMKHKIDIFDINSIYSSTSTNKQNTNKLNFVYKNLEDNPKYNNKNPYSDLIILIHLFSLEGQVKINREIPNSIVLINLIEIYNKIYISNIFLSILIYLEIVILINMHLFSHKNKKNYFEYNQTTKFNSIYKNMELTDSNNISSFFSPQKTNNNRRKINLTSNLTNNLKSIKDNNFPNFYLFDNEIAPYSYDSSIKIFMFQNYLKLYIFYYLSKSKIKLIVNLTIENIHELIKKIKNNNIFNEEMQSFEQKVPLSARGFQGSLAPNNNFAENLKNCIKVNKKFDNNEQKKDSNNNRRSFDSANMNRNIIFPKLSILYEIQSQSINLSELKIMNKNILNLCFSSFNFEQLLIKLINTMDLSQIKTINSNYQDLIAKSNLCYFQESIYSFSPIENDDDFNDNSLTPRNYPNSKVNLNNLTKNDNITDNLTIDDFFDECAILYYFLEFYGHLEVKKLPKVIHIKLNTFKCNINQKTKSMQVFFNFSNIKEKKLFQYLKESKNMLIFVQKYQLIIQCLKEYKLYQNTIRVSQTNFRSNQLNYFFTFITHKLVDYIEEMKLSKIIVYETQLGSYNPNMKVFLKDIYTKKKEQILNLKQIIISCSFFNKIKVLLEYVFDFVDQWDLIVFSDSEKDIKLLRTLDDNKLFLFITRDNDLNENTNKLLLKVINNENGKKEKEKDSVKNAKNNNNGKLSVYEYLNIIMYIKNSPEDYIKIVNTLQLLSMNKNSVLDYKTNLICDRYFFEQKILLDQRMQQLQQSISNLVDDFFFISKKSSHFIKNNDNNSNDNKPNKENNESKENNSSNKNYNYDCFIGDDYVGVLNNHQYDVSSDVKNNFNKLIYDYLSVLSSCLELIYFVLKSKNIFILRFVYILRTKNDTYYTWEYKNSNIFVKRIRDFTSLFTLNIKNSIPLFCFLSKKENQITGAGGDDNFYDVFLRLFLNLNKVVDNNDLNTEFFRKIHKNIFNDYYSSFLLVAFSYESFLFFNDFFIKNNYLDISNGEKFEKCIIIPIEGYFNFKEYLRIISLFNSPDQNKNLIVKDVNIFNFSIDSNYLFKNKLNILFGFSKVDYFIKEYNNHIFNNILTEFKQKKDYLKKKFEEKITKKQNKKNINKFLKIIQEFTFGNYDTEINGNDNEDKSKILVFNSPIDLYNVIINDYIKEKMLIKTQKNELNVFQVEESRNTETKNNNINSINNKKDCAIF